MTASWRDSFGTTAMMRGIDYHEDGLVELTMRDSSGWHGVAHGYRDYSLVIGLSENGEPDLLSRETYCSCPRFADGYRCKHLAAACLAIEERNEKQGAFSAWDTLLDSLGDSDARAFLHEVLEYDERWRREFVSRFGDTDIDEIRRSIAREIDSTVDLYIRGGGYLDWRDALAFEHDIRGVISRTAQPLLKQGRWREAFETGLASLAELRQIEIDDEGGVYDSLTDACISVWREIAECGGDAGADTVAEGVLAFLGEDPGDEFEGDILCDQQEAARDFFASQFADDPRHAQRVLDIMKDQLSVPVYRATYDGYEQVPFGSSTVRCVETGLRALHALGASMAVRRDFAEPYMACVPVRLLLVDELIEEGVVDEAVSLLVEGRGLCKRAEERVAVESRLLGQYERAGKTDGVRECLDRLILVESDDGQLIEYWHRLKNVCDSEQWAKTSRDLLDSLRVRSCKCALLAEEGRLGELMDCIERGNDLAVLDRYCDVLSPEYSDRVIALYRNRLMRQLNQASCRDHYRNALVYLRRIGDIPGGEVEFKNLAATIRATWPRRSALLDELSRIGG